MNMLALMYVAIGGAVGSMLRYLLATLVGNASGTDFPYGTLTINIVGGLLMGAWVAVLSHMAPGKAEDMHKLIAVGLLGGFTTFSAFSLDIYLLMDRGLAVQATIYIMASVALSLFALLGGMYVVKLAMG